MTDESAQTRLPAFVHPSAFILHPFRPFRVGRRDQAKLAVEDVDQVVEVPGAVRITRCFEQFLARSHLSLDVGAALGKQGFQNRLSRLLVQAMLGRSGRGAEGLFEERDADPSVPPTSLSVAGVQGLPFTISAKRASRTEMILPSWASPRSLDPEMHS